MAPPTFVQTVLEKFSARFPYSSGVSVDGFGYPAGEVLRVLAPRLSETRLTRLKRVVEARTVSLVPAIEGLSDPGNVNAIIRSAEGLGCAAVHLVAMEGSAAEMVKGWMNEGDAAVQSGDVRATTRVSQGAEKWMHVAAFESRRRYVMWAKNRGYRVVAMALREDAVPVDAVDFSVPTVLVVGNESDGVSETLLDAADETARLPIDGLVQSYNASVASALALYQARGDRIARLGRHADLSDEEREVLLAHYLSRAVDHAGAILRRELGGEASG